VLNRAIIDEVRTVRDGDAFETMKQLASHEGILAGLSAGESQLTTGDVLRFLTLGAGRRRVGSVLTAEVKN
jgi:cysteine synthase